MPFWDDFAEGLQMPFKWAEKKFDKADKLVDKVADSAGNAAGGLADLLGGNSNILLYIGIAVVAVVVLPTVLNKVL